VCMNHTESVVTYINIETNGFRYRMSLFHVCPFRNIHTYIHTYIHTCMHAHVCLNINIKTNHIRISKIMHAHLYLLYAYPIAGGDGVASDRVWQNSWGLTTRTIGVSIMVHGDDKGLVLPPKVSPTQVILVPIFYKSKEVNDLILQTVEEMKTALKGANVRAAIDARTDKTPAWKYAHHEQRGVPIRLEVGEKDLNKGELLVDMAFEFYIFFHSFSAFMYLFVYLSMYLQVCIYAYVCRYVDVSM
jgi:hypothetical protein